MKTAREQPADHGRVNIGVVALQLSVSQGQCSVMERAHHCSLFPNPVHHAILQNLASISP